MRLLISIGIVFAILLVLAALLLPGLGRNARGPATYSRVKNDLKQIGIAFHNYHDTYGSFPPAVLRNLEGQQTHGWMTALLPFMEQGPLYEQIDLEILWDDSSQKVLFEQRVDGYESTAVDSRPVANSTFAPAHFAGNMHVIVEGEPLAFTDFTDGMSNTLLAGEAFGNFEPWGKPGNVRDPMLGINKSKDGFGTQIEYSVGWFGGKKRRFGCTMVLADGAVRFISEDIDPETLRRLALPNDGEPVGEF